MLDDDYIDIPPEPGARDIGEIHPEQLELEKVPRHLWEQVLAPLRRWPRMCVATRIPDEQLRALAIEVVMGLDAAESRDRQDRDAARHRARRTAAPLPAPDAAHAATRSTVQVNFRLRRDDYARLQEAAKAVGMKPTTLARAFVLNGANKVLQERGAT